MGAALALMESGKAETDVILIIIQFLCDSLMAEFSDIGDRLTDFRFFVIWVLISCNEKWTEKKVYAVIIVRR